MPWCPGFAGEAITLGGTLENTPAAGQAPAPQQAWRCQRTGACHLAEGGLGTGRPEEASVAIDEWLSSFSRTLYWIDNHNEAALRPDTAQYPQPILKFRLDGTGEFVQLTQENMAQLGLQQMPQAAVSQAGVGSYLVTVGDQTLPVKYTEIDPYGDETQHTVGWQIEPAACEGYAIQKVEQEELPQFSLGRRQSGLVLCAAKQTLPSVFACAGARRAARPASARPLPGILPSPPSRRGRQIQPVSAGRFGRRRCRSNATPRQTQTTPLRVP